MVVLEDSTGALDQVVDRQAFVDLIVSDTQATAFSATPISVYRNERHALLAAA